MDINIYDKNQKLIYGYSNEKNYKTVKILKFNSFILKGYSNILESIEMGALLDEMISSKELSIFFNKDNSLEKDPELIFKIMNKISNKLFYKNNKPSKLKNVDLRFIVSEKIKAILDDRGNSIDIQAQGEVEVLPNFKKNKELTIYYTMNDTNNNNLEIRYKNTKFKVKDEKKSILMYTFKPNLPLKLKKENDKFIIRNCLSDKSNINIKFPKTNQIGNQIGNQIDNRIDNRIDNIEVSCNVGDVIFSENYIEWKIKNLDFKIAEIEIKNYRNTRNILIEFESFCFSLSMLLIKAVRDENERKEVWVNYSCRSDLYEVRRRE